MDQSQRANAAQLAARNIKAKPKARRPGMGGSVTGSNSQTPQFAPMTSQPQNGGGALFGGGIADQNGGAFSFSAAAPASLSFPGAGFGNQNSGFGNSSTDASNNIGHWEEENRATKRTFGGSTAISQSNSFPPTSFGQSQPTNMFGSGSQQPTSGGSIFSFGGSQQSAAPAFNSTPASQPPATSAFSFGTSTQPSTSMPFSFGNPMAENKPPSSLFSFNSQPSQPKSGGSGFNFGTPAAQEKSASTPFLFGQAPAQSSGSNINFGSGSGPAPQNTATNSTFQFGQSPAAQTTTSGFAFGSGSATSTPSHEQPANSPFSFNRSSSQPASTSIFGSGATPASQEKPASSLFQMGQNSAPTSSSSIFSSTPAPEASTPQFSFGTAISTSTNTSGFSIGNIAAASPQSQPTTSNIFGNLKPSEPMKTDFFGSTPTASSASTNSETQPASTGFLFGKSNENNATTSQPFGEQKQAQQVSSNLFGQSSQAASPSFSFGQKTAEVKPGDTGISDKTQSLFSTLNNYAAPSSNLFGTSPATTSNIHSLNQPVEPSVIEPKINGIANPPSATISNAASIFGAAPASNLFSQPKSFVSSRIPNLSIGSANTLKPSPSAPASSVESHNKPSFVFGYSQPSASQSPPKNNTSSPLKTFDAPAAASHPPPSGMFPSLSGPVQRAAGASPLPPNRFMPANYAENDVAADLYAVHDAKDEEILGIVPATYSDEDRQKFIAAFRITTLNQAFYKIQRQIGTGDMSLFMDFYNEERNLTLAYYMATIKDMKRKSTDEFEDENPNKRARQAPPVISASAEASTKRSVSGEDEENENPAKRTRPFRGPESTGYTNDSDHAISQPPPPSPAKMSLPPPPSPAKMSLPPPPSSNASPATIFTSLAAPSPSPGKSKRKATDELTKDTENLSPLQREIKTPRLNGSSVSPRSESQTSKIFKDIVESPSQARPVKSSPQKRAGSPEKSQDEAPRFNPFGGLPVPKKTPSWPEKTKNDIPRGNPFASAPVPKSPEKAAVSPLPNTTTPQAPPAPAASLFLFKPSSTPMATNNATAPSAPASSFSFKAPTAASDANGESSNMATSNPFTLKGLPTTAPGISAIEAFRLKAEKDKAKKKEEDFQKYWDEGFDSDEDDKREVRKNWEQNHEAEQKELEELAKRPSGLTFKLSGTISDHKVGTGTSAIEEFRLKAEKDAAKKKEDDFQKYWDEECDSEDDDKEEVREKWERDNEARKKELEELAKRPSGFTFKPSGTTLDDKGSNFFKPTFQPSTQTTESSTSTSKPLFGAANTTSQSSNNSLFGSLNGSRTPTPGPVGSGTGSVLDGHIPGKPVSFSGNNIFSHLSDTGSGKDDDGDDDDGSDLEQDSENKDPNYKPENEIESGTPPGKTGAGIASAKKANPFALSNGSSFGAGSTNLFSKSSNSGTSSPGGSLFDRVGSKKVDEPVKEDSPSKEDGGTTTPGGSLFDRIPTDSNGNPIRHISIEEKENTKPSSGNSFRASTNPFASLNKTSSGPSDHTWKPDSPIKFGTSTSGTASAPTLSVTAATPTKTGSPSNLFGNLTSTTPGSPVQFSNLFGTKPTTTPTSNLFGSKTDTKTTSNSFSNLFGSSSASKPAPANVGFGFGAVSTTSSLFPSAAGSPSTSRATSPGATTDGDSGVEGDPDAEKHEQIDLTAGGPGEENEQVVHEVRAKALKFCPRDEGDSTSPWETKGLGPLRVLKHKETGAYRILLRQDPSGKVILNKGLIPTFKYEATGKTMKLMCANDSGKGLETWMVQVKTEDFAKKLAGVLEENKPSS